MSEDTLYEYMTMEENISFFHKLFDENEEYLKKIDVMKNELNLKQYDTYLVKNLSQGTRNKLYLIIQLARNSKLIILDEPFTALDSHSQDFFISNIKNAICDNKTILMVTHIDEFKKIATRNIVIEKNIA